MTDKMLLTNYEITQDVIHKKTWEHRIPQVQNLGGLLHAQPAIGQSASQPTTMNRHCPRCRLLEMRVWCFSLYPRASSEGLDTRIVVPLILWTWGVWNPIPTCYGDTSKHPNRKFEASQIQKLEQSTLVKK